MPADGTPLQLAPEHRDLYARITYPINEGE